MYHDKSRGRESERDGKIFSDRRQDGNVCMAHAEAHPQKVR